MMALAPDAGSAIQVRSSWDPDFARAVEEIGREARRAIDATVLEVSTDPRGGFFVLWVRDARPLQPVREGSRTYGTHCAEIKGDGTATLYSGGYDLTLEQAVEDYKDRGGTL